MEEPTVNNDKAAQQPDRNKGKWAAYSFSLVVTVFLVFQCWSAERRSVEVPMATWMPALLLIGVGLGVQIDPKDLLR